MQLKRFYLLLWGISIAILAYGLLEHWDRRNAADPVKFERLWEEDVHDLESSGKLPKPWFDVREIELVGGNPEGKRWLRQIHVPISIKKPEGDHKLEILVVPWREDGQRGVMIQYNLVNIKSQNMIFELGRTLILSQPHDKDPVKAFLQDLGL